MKNYHKYVQILEDAHANYEKKHPHWRVEVLLSLIKRGLECLRHYIEDKRDSEITWENPFVELRYPVQWNWKTDDAGDEIRSGMVFGKLTKANTRDKATLGKTLSHILARRCTLLALGDFTNGAWFEISGDHWLPYLPKELDAALNTINGKQARRAAFDEIVAPFSIGGGVIKGDFNKLRSGAPIPRRLTKQIGRIRNPLGIQKLGFTAEINGREIEMSVIFQIHPLIANRNEKKAYHPIIIGLFIQPTQVGTAMVTKTPSAWPRKDREQLWRELMAAADGLVTQLIPKVESDSSVILKVNAEMRIPAELWQAETKGMLVKQIMDCLAPAGHLEKIQVEAAGRGVGPVGNSSCPVCGWVHDTGFTQINTGQDKMIFLRGILPDIVRLVHAAHEKGLAGLNSKDEELLKVCGGYRHPCKAFDDLRHRADYKRLFDRSRRGFITLRSGRKESEQIGSPAGMTFQSGGAKLTA